jgi:Fibronectin type III domain
MELKIFSVGAALLLTPAILISNQTPAAAQTIYVSPTGNDHNPGTESHPFRTLQRARDWARSKNQTQTNDLTIFLEGGTYRLTEPLVLDARDSGNNGYNVIYAAAPGQHPVVSGGVRITGWKLVDAGKNLWSAPAPANLKDTRQLYVNGVRAERTRGRLPVKLTETKTGYIADSPVMAGWRNPSDIEFVYTGGNGFWSEHSEGLGAWTEPRCPVASIEGTTITMAQPCWDNSTKRVMLPPSSGFHRTANLVGPASIGHEPEYVENAYELLGTPGQFYFDRTAGKFYYVPRSGEDMTTADVEAPVLQTLISGEGAEDAPVHNIIFKDIQFSYATWLYPDSDEGFSEIQANYMVTGRDGYATQGLCDLASGGKCPFGVWTPTPGNVAFRYDHAIQFLNDDFVHLGGAGLALGDGSQTDTVEGCVFTDVSANGIELGGVDLPEGNAAQVTRDNRILNNHIYNVAAEYHGGIGIDVGYAQDSLIAHNQLDHLPYTGISMGWGGWPDKIHRAGVANNSRNNVVADNLIFDHMQLLADGGAIYTQGLTGPSLADGEKIIGNVIYNQLGSGHGIYTDNGCNNVTARSNVIFNVNFDDWGSRHRDYYDDHRGKVYDAFDFEDNYWQQGDRDSSRENVTLRNNHLISAMNQAPQNIRQNAGLQPAFKNILNQRFGNPSAPEPPSRVAAAAGNGFALVAWNPSIFDGGAPVESYTVTSSQGDQATISEADYQASGYVKMTGLENGQDYTFAVEARNANGVSAPSLPSATVVPNDRAIHPPSAPTQAYAESGNGMASIHFRGAQHDGGSPIIGYVITAEPGGRKLIITGRAALTLGGRHTTFAVVDDLENGKHYKFEVAAVNAAGVGTSISTRPVTPTADISDAP